MTGKLPNRWSPCVGQPNGLRTGAGGGGGEPNLQILRSKGLVGSLAYLSPCTTGDLQAVGLNPTDSRLEGHHHAK